MFYLFFSKRRKEWSKRKPVSQLEVLEVMRAEFINVICIADVLNFKQNCFKMFLLQ